MEFDVNRYSEKYAKREFEEILNKTAKSKSLEEIEYEEENYKIERRDGFAKNLKKILNEFGDNKTKFEYENQDVFEYFPIDKLEKEDVEKLIDHITELKEGGRNGNKVMYNIKKVTYDLDDKRFDDLKTDNTISIFDFSQFRSIMKQLIKSATIEDLRKMQELTIKLCGATLNNGTENDLHNLISLLTYTMSQAIIYWVVTRDGVSSSKKAEAMEKINNYIDSFIKEEKPKVEKIELDSSLPIFICILKIRNKLLMESGVCKILMEEQELEQELFKQYRTIKTDIAEGRNLKEILNEGNVRCDNFEEKVEQAKQLISLLRTRRGRNASEDSLMDIKVYFRELYISKSKYKRTALHIAKRMVDSNVENDAEYFLNEKISRGYFREKVPLELYNLKNEVQNKLNVAQIENLLPYDDMQGILNREYLFVCDLLKVAFLSVM